MKKHVSVFVGILLFSITVFADDAIDTVTVTAGSPSSGGLPRIAVYVTGSVDDNEKRVLSTRLQTALIMSGRYTDAERPNAFLVEVETAQAEQPNGVLDNDQISEIGKRFGVSYVCIADVTSAFGEHNVSARIINVENVTVSFAGTAHGPLQTMDDLVDIANGVVRSMFGGRAEPVPPKPVSVPAPVAVAPSPPPPAPVAVAPPPAPVAVAPPPPPVSVSVSVSAPLPAPIALRTGTSMADRAKTMAAEKILETVMSQIIPQIKRMVAAAPVSSEAKADAERRLTLIARNIVITALNDGMSGKMPNPQQLLTQVLGEIRNLARDLLGDISIDITVEGGGGGGAGGQTGQTSGGRTRAGMRLAYNASNSNVDIVEHNRIIQSQFGSGWECGFVLNTSISDVWVFNYGANMAFRAPVNSSNLRVTETSISVPLMFRWTTPPNTSGSLFLESGFMPGLIWTPKDDHGRRISERRPVDFAYVVGSGFGLGRYVEFDSKFIWSMVDYVDVQSAKKLVQISSGLTIMFKERR